ncbi:MAG TPA: hypothetical protein VM241_02260 [Candidatus Thermoplasmatota archaeon]|nr:hypothetical protein [Candidatus Thermoplasmatota archaeon]
MVRPIGEIMQLRLKRKRGEALSLEEEAKLRAYYGRYNRRKKGVHLKGAREEL